MTNAQLFVIVGATLIVFTSWWIIGKLLRRPQWFSTLIRLMVSGAIIIGAYVWFSTTESAISDAAPPNPYIGVDGVPLQPIDSVVAQVGNLPITVAASSTLIPVQQVNLNAESTQPVREVMVRVGQVVRKQDKLAQLNATEAESALRLAQINLEDATAAFNALVEPPRAIDIQVAQVAITAARASVAAASQRARTSEIEAARLQVELAKNQLWQAQLQRDLSGTPKTTWISSETYSGGFVNVVSSLRNAEQQIAVAQAEYTRLKAQKPNAGPLSSANARLVQTQTELDTLLKGPIAARRQRAALDVATALSAVKAAEDRLQQTALVAPMDGVVAAINLTVGQVPPTDKPSVVLINPAAFNLDLPIDESDIAAIQVGQSAQIRLDAFAGETLSGIVTQVASAPTVQSASQSATNASGASTRVTYLVRVTINAESFQLRAGMRATGEVILRELNAVVLVPNRFIQTDAATQTSFVVVQRAVGQYERVSVILGARSRTQTQIMVGVQPGDTIVLMSEPPTQPSGGLF